jgi:hypothetical protein
MTVRSLSNPLAELGHARGRVSEARGRGVGSMLLDAVEYMLTELGARIW